MVETNQTTTTQSKMSLSKELFEKLREPFPREAHDVDNSRGFPLTSIKAQWIVERLNEVFGIFDWEFVPDFEQTEKGVRCFGVLQVHSESSTRTVKATGWSAWKRNEGDTFKSCYTDSLTKAASYIGVGNDVFKGNVNLNVSPDVKTKKPDDIFKHFESESNPGEYVFNLPKFKGKMLKNIDRGELMNWYKYMKSQPTVNGKAKEHVSAIELYLAG